MGLAIFSLILALVKAKPTAICLQNELFPVWTSTGAAW